MKADVTGARGAVIEDRTCQQCGEVFRYNVSPSRGPSRGLFCSIPCQRLGRRRSHEPTNWKGGRRVRPDRRIEVYVRPGEPFAEMRTTNGYVLEHRLVVARLLGRSLLPSESVHHINGDPADNRPENLQFRFALAHGQGQVYCCAECGSRNLRPVEL